MQNEISDHWRNTHLTRLSRMLRLIGAVLYLTFVLVVLAFADPALSRSVLGVIILSALVLVAVYDFYFIFNRGVRWNSAEIQQTGTFLPSQVHRWDDLSSVLPNMHKRATVLTFKGFGHVKLYWGLDAHREILDFAKERLKHA